MKKEQIIDVFFRKVQQIKRFLTSKDLFIFLFFLMISTGLWGLHALRKTYETVIRIPLTYENLPAGIVQTEELPTNLAITVSDRGNFLFGYRLSSGFAPISIDLKESMEGNADVVTKTLEPIIQKQLNPTTQILKINPSLLHFGFVALKKKQLPVLLVQRIDLAQQYTLCGPIEISPRQVEVFAPENILDTMQFVYTEPLVVHNLKDTIRQTVPLKTMKDAVYSSANVTVTVKAEPYTEKTLEIPIVASNVPPNHILRIFPSVINVSFQLGFSLYDKINASSFSLIADYDKIQEGNGRKKLPVEIDKQPSKIFNLKINPKQVDYLIEEKQ